jgi:hydroxymethylglutaryl-CoA lyase
MDSPDSVRLVEVGPRDGLQNEPTPVSVEAKVAFIEALADAGLKDIESGSFVSPRWVPQMADSAEVFKRIRRVPGVTYSALVPNLKGLEAAIASGVEEIAVFGSASESFSRRNINCSIAESLERFRPVCKDALAHGMRVRGYVSCGLGCPYEGEISPEAVADVTTKLIELGCYEVALSDTIGVGTPGKARAMFSTVAKEVPTERLALHFHDTYGQALANILACLDLGARSIDSAAAGLGGCPYASGASGNVATEDVVFMLDGMGVRTGVDLEKLVAAGRLISGELGRAPNSRLGRIERRWPALAAAE